MGHPVDHHFQRNDFAVGPLSFNISLGTPPQSVPVVIDLYQGDVNINNRTRDVYADNRDVSSDEPYGCKRFFRSWFEAR